MHLQLPDWIIIITVMALLLGSGAWAGGLVRNVADFLSAGRCAGRYLLCISQGMAGLGAITFVAYFESYYQAGFAALWWSWMLLPLGLIMALSGFVVCRYRETRAMTLAQFFEMRYGRRFRIFAGVVIWVSGMLNYGVFPGVTARFLLSFCGFPAYLEIGTLRVSNYLLIMLIMLAMALFLTLKGGQIAVMVSDFFQGVLVMLVLLIVVLTLFLKFPWQEVAGILEQAPPGMSLVNPFDQAVDKIRDFNVFFFLMSVWINIYTYRAWQSGQGYSSAARSPHEARMAGILAEWRGQTTLLGFLMIPIFSWVLMHHPKYGEVAARVTANLARYPDLQTRTQMLVPEALSQMLPVGLAGLFVVVIISAAVSTDDTCIHSWGSIFVQDILIPLRGKVFDTATHLRLLRLAIFVVGLLSVLFSLFFPLRDFILMYLAITGAVYTGGAGAVIIGGLYWKRGTAAGAWTAMIAGGLLALAGIVAKTFWNDLPWLSEHWGETCPFNGMQVTFFASLAALALYVGISLLTCRKPFDLNRMLHRENASGKPPARRSWQERLGIGPEFTRGDQFIYFFKIGWAVFWFGAFLTGTVIGQCFHTTNAQWLVWWRWVVFLILAVVLVTTVWFLWGGIRDLVALNRTLRTMVRDDADDGRVPPPSGDD